ncbi:MULTISPECIES: HD domain-containing protein [unclassified Candidatus Tisiphia]|uniref:HD domain-containing protein n=1 Tax=unclassified Candidatus Tisiphia TaxID=2996318 RepID=UPI003CCA8EB3
MEDINDWEVKYENCKYADRLLTKLMQMNQEVNRPIDIKEVKKAIYYAKKYHGSQMRQSGEPYYSHPIEVAYMTSDYLFRTDIIVTSILHDTIEDTELSKSMIASIFGEQVASQVEDLTRVKSYGKISAAETIELLFQQKKKDILLIKLFDRLHNMQTIGAKSPEKIKKIVEETLREFVVLSIYLGMPEIKYHFIKMCFQHLTITHCPTPDLYQLFSLDNSQPLFPTFQNDADPKCIL